ncbi:MULTISPECIES: acyl carrier protein [Burkholderia cepacia complex]|jgi:acyl carrier protein|uniref:Phosphopantetheine-binding protein n=2 Tax=Burkholderia cepacia complex TaxID=87882 RepID=A0AAD0NBG3_9BURK|nr:MULTISPECIES: acyl carrier protein [Burkholderia cepacia complex]ACA93418.1 phosphopantetheine-binding [Burkholderia orbicola MC0-3]AWG29438.1 phosphopantetheine-binding protein [Burkholderia cenocepacia]MBR8155438.1 acyl carrier protein [Burkholderia cenocepacia]MBR8412901.1 acyl carrier protein [Burkholderia cenocepacia]MCA8087683.1 acyl carrier protein [Burkholderia cenocepacia]
MTSNSVSNRADDIATVLKSCLLSTLGTHLSAELIEGDTNLFDLGVDSMNMTELLLQVEQRFKIALEPEDLSSDLFLRFDNLVAFVASHAPSN